MSVRAIVLHPGYEPAEGWTERPSSTVVGSWAANASCVVISPDCVVTTNHQGGGVGSIVVVGGNSFVVTRVERYAATDIRVAKLRYCSFADYVSPYTGSSELFKSFVIGGYGMGRGQELQTSGVTYGYLWDGTANTTLRWGTNMIDSVRNADDILVADFDAPGFFTTDYEAILAQKDSGGGWFMKSGGKWVLIGLSYSVTPHPGSPSQSRFKDPVTLASAPDEMYGHRLSTYASWINTTAAKLAGCGSHPEDISQDCKVNIVDIQELAKWWISAPAESPARDRADVNSDAAVNMLDFAKVAAQWNLDYW